MISFGLYSFTYRLNVSASNCSFVLLLTKKKRKRKKNLFNVSLSLQYGKTIWLWTSKQSKRSSYVSRWACLCNVCVFAWVIYGEQQMNARSGTGGSDETNNKRNSGLPVNCFKSLLQRLLHTPTFSSICISIYSVEFHPSTPNHRNIVHRLSKGSSREPIQ